MPPSTPPTTPPLEEDTSSDEAMARLHALAQLELQQARVPMGTRTSRPPSNRTLYLSATQVRELEGQLDTVAGSSLYPGHELVLRRPDLIPMQHHGLARPPPAAHSPPSTLHTHGDGDDDDGLAAALEASRREDAAMQQLGVLFSEISHAELRACLERFSFDVNAAANELIELGIHY